MLEPVKIAFTIFITGLLFVILVACTGEGIVADPNPSSIDSAHQRVETRVCDRYGVGENGCILPEGRVGGNLEIHKIGAGRISITGQGCAVDYASQYAAGGDEWITIPLQSLLGDQLTNDCVLTIFQLPTLKDQARSPIPVRGMAGNVTIGTCPAGVKCTFQADQYRAGAVIPKFSPTVSAEGQLLFRGCGQEILPAQNYTTKPSIDLKSVWPNGYPSEGRNGCNFILSVKGSDGLRYKHYRRVWLYAKDTVLVNIPTIEGNKFTGDQFVSLSSADGVDIDGRVGSFKPYPEGNVLRFYTVQGRSLVVVVKNGVIQWAR